MNERSKYVFEEEPVKKGYASPEFIKKWNISKISYPANWFKAFLSNKVSKAYKYGMDT